MEAGGSSETSLNFHQTPGLHIPDDSTLPSDVLSIILILMTFSYHLFTLPSR
jgi:hypothetical protein